MQHKVSTILLEGDCTRLMDKDHLAQVGAHEGFALTFLDPPFNQGKAYEYYADTLPETKYWDWMRGVCAAIREFTLAGGAVYFMQREKKVENLLRCLRESGWLLQNVIVWAKKTSAVPGRLRFGKQYQVIAFATNGPRPRLFNRVRIDPPLPVGYRKARSNGLFVTDVWNDIREMTSGYFAGDEALRSSNGERAHRQQSPVALMARIMISSSRPGDWVLDPFSGSGTTAVVAEQLGRNSVSIEIDPKNARLQAERLVARREADSVMKLRDYYRYTPSLDSIWPREQIEPVAAASIGRPIVQEAVAADSGSRS